MSAPVFVVDPAEAAAAQVGGLIEVGGAEGRHAVGVRRLAAPEPVELVDGRGVRLRCTVEGTRGRDVLVLRVHGRLDEPVPSPRVVVVQALPKGERSDLAVELLTEVGADEVVPWAASRCVAVWRGEKAARGPERWRATAREAAKQARRAWIPEVAPLASTADVAARVRAAGAAWVLHEEAPAPLTALLASVPDASGGDVVLVVGPEGGVAPDELAVLEEAGARAALLGPTVLRTSTAGGVAAALVLARFGRW